MLTTLRFFVQDIDSIKLIFDLFNYFSIFSGFKLNMAKSEVCGIGALKGVSTALCNIKNINLLQDTIKVLGIHFSYNCILRNNNNFVSSIKKIENVLKLWKMRHLTLQGKIIIFKTLAISKIVFVSYISSLPDTMMCQLKQIHDNFI